MESKNNNVSAIMQETTPENEKELSMQESLRSIYQSKKGNFEKKTFGEDFFYFYWFCYFFTYFLALVSIANAIGFFVGKFQSAGIVIALVFGAVVTVLLEWLKTFFFTKSVTGFYAIGRTATNFVLLFSFLVCLFFSVLTSVLGAGELVKYFDKRQTETNTQTQVEADRLQTTRDRQSEQARKDHEQATRDIKADYAKRTQAERTALADYKASVTWQGKIDIHNPTNAQTINAYQQRITALQQAERNDIEKTNLAYTQAGTQVNENYKRYQTRLDTRYKETTAQNAESFWNWFYLALIVAGATEIAICLSNWFVIYFEYIIIKYEPNKSLSKVSMQDLANSFKSFLYLMKTGRQDLPTNAQHLQQVLHKDLPQDLPKNEIGFKTKKQDLPNMPPTLEEALRQGITDTRLLTKYYSVNINEVNRVREAIQPKEPSKSLIVTPDLFSTFAKEGKT